MTSKIHSYLFSVLMVIAMLFGTSSAQAIDKIVHDAEYYILEAQNVEKWKADDKVVDKKLAEFRTKNGGNPPNILYILIDDIGFGDLGDPVLNSIRGYKTPNINKIAYQGMRGYLVTSDFFKDIQLSVSGVLLLLIVLFIPAGAIGWLRQRFPSLRRVLA